MTGTHKDTLACAYLITSNFDVMNNIQERVTHFTVKWHKIHASVLVPEEWVDKRKEGSSLGGTCYTEDSQER